MEIVPVTGKLPATRAAVDYFLAAPRLMRLGVTEPDGPPLVHPLWYTWEQDQFLLHIGTTSSKRTAIDTQPRVGVAPYLSHCTMLPTGGGMRRPVVRSKNLRSGSGTANW
jgi:nitroimidazol reductase NimA-like FMN-containing flavoprotein (pyridoxamine 5'-phosphate oxidase superfamily)